MLFTDIEGSTQLTHRLGERYREVVTDHRRLLEEAFKAHDGRIVDRQTESFFAVFPRVGDAARAAAAAQRALAAHPWPDGEQVSVRMGIHAGEPELDGDRYVGLAVSRGARVAASAHGGQVLLSGAAHSLLADQRFSTRRLGSFPLKDFDAPEPLYQLLVEGLPDRFPRPRVEPRRSRRRAVAVAAAVLLAVVVVALLAAFMGGSGGGLSGVQANHVGLIDPGTNEIVDEVSVGIKPGPIAFGMGSAWVGNLADRNLTRVDARTRERAGTISLDNQTPTGIAVGGDAVWVAHGPLGKLSRVDPQFGQVTTTLDLAEPSGAGVVTFGGARRLGGVRRVDTRAGRSDLDAAHRTGPCRWKSGWDRVRPSASVGRQQRRPDREPLQSGHVPGRVATADHGRARAGRHRVRCERDLGRQQGRRHRDEDQPARRRVSLDGDH